ncbi:MAG: hypothetical protein WC714_19955 [Candidatus Obscuribacterales bacterium]
MADEATAATLSFEDNTSFADWLEEHDYFDCGCAGHFDPEPTTFGLEAGAPERVSFQLGFPVGGSYDAGQLRRVKRYEFIANGVELWAYTKEHAASFGFDGPLLGGVIVNDENTLIDLVIDDLIQLQCRRIQVSELSDLTVVNLPALNRRSATLFFADTALPIPADWIEWLNEVGADASWRRIHDVAVAPSEVNLDDYEGWFLQSRNLIDSTPSGVMLKSLKVVEGGFFAEFDNWEEPVDGQSTSEIWSNLSQVTSLRPNVFVRSGNCLLTGEEWKRALLEPAATLDKIDFGERSNEGLGGWFPAWCDPEQDLPPRYVTPGGNASNFGRWPYIRWVSENQMQWHWEGDSKGP